MSSSELKLRLDALRSMRAIGTDYGTKELEKKIQLVEKQITALTMRNKIERLNNV
jgi:uncharacterized protein YheU (UPF0270 family)